MFEGGSVNPPANAGDIGDSGLIPGLGRFPWTKKWHPLQYSCLEISHGQRSLVDYSPWEERIGRDSVTEHAHTRLKVHPADTGHVAHGQPDRLMTDDAFLSTSMSHLLSFCWDHRVGPAYEHFYLLSASQIIHNHTHTHTKWERKTNRESPFPVMLKAEANATILSTDWICVVKSGQCYSVDGSVLWPKGASLSPGVQCFSSNLSLTVEIYHTKAQPPLRHSSVWLCVK